MLGVEVRSKTRTYSGVGNMRADVSDWVVLLQQHSGGLSNRPQTPRQLLYSAPQLHPEQHARVGNLPVGTDGATGQQLPIPRMYATHSHEQLHYRYGA